MKKGRRPRRPFDFQIGVGEGGHRAALPMRLRARLDLALLGPPEWIMVTAQLCRIRRRAEALARGRVQTATARGG